MLVGAIDILEEFDLVFVHGWSARHTETYGGLPERLIAEGTRYGLRLTRRDIVLGHYVSFSDEVRVADLVEAMDAAIRDLDVPTNRKFICITHSTGGPLVRMWYERFYASNRRRCPVSHLVMLAPANFGSALAQLGKSRVGQMASWFQGIEPGQGVLDWLELGSEALWAMNEAWIRSGARPPRLWPFVLIGQTIDRKLYDNLNTYTGEDGSDGVVRVASANLNASYVSLKPKPGSRRFDALEVNEVISGPKVAMRVVPGRAHAGKDLGIMRSVRSRRTNDSVDNEITVNAIMRCFLVRTRNQYNRLCAAFDAETEALQSQEQVEESPRFISRRTFVHDIYSQVIFRVRDSQQCELNDFELLLTAKRASPNTLPVGFLKDRQRNRLQRSTLTYYLNHNIMTGNTEIPGVREKSPGCIQLGLEVHAKPNRGLVRFKDAKLQASASILKALLRANETVLVDIEIDRQVDKETFRLERTTKRRNFGKARPSGDRV